ncbi:MAG: 30S ribosomal protein S1 [Planctomycetota bacterium]
MDIGKNLIKELDKDKEFVEREVKAAFEDVKESDDTVEQLYESSMKNFQVGKIIDGRVINVHGGDVVIDVGYKSEGMVQASEFGGDVPDVGDEVEVLLEAVEDESGLLALSKRKADRIRGWERVIEENDEGDVVTGRVMRKIKGGLLVDIGVPVFLPASQVAIRRSGDIAQWIGREIKCKIIKIDKGRRNIVVSRRRVIEEKREKMKEKLMKEIEVGERRTGEVKNIVDFGAFVDLGGIDGLLHITDMSWGRISHPSEMVAVDEEIEVVILDIDYERERISLGLKQKEPSPWEDIEEKYPVGSKVRGQVVNVMSYGAFVKLEEGVEGLVHISEMSWTRRISHPSEVVAIGDMVDVVVLGINREKEEISLGMKQTEVNPWELVEEKYPVGTVIKGRVRNMTNYGAFIEIEEGIDGLLHVSDMSWTKKVNHPSEMLSKGDQVEVIVLSVDQKKKRVALGMKQLAPDPWLDRIPQQYVVGDVVEGKITKLTNFGVFVELEPDLEGLLHVSELADEHVDSPEDMVEEGEDVEVRIIRVDTQERKIGLSMRQVHDRLDTAPSAKEETPRPAPKPEPSRQPRPGREFGQAVLSEEMAQQVAESQEAAAEEETEPEEEAQTEEPEPGAGAEPQAEEEPQTEEAEEAAAEEGETPETAEPQAEAPEETDAEEAGESGAEKEAGEDKP